jgi:hypothetical protein
MKNHWWDNIETKNKKNLEVRFFSKSFKEAITALEIIREISSAWTWEVHV